MNFTKRVPDVIYRDASGTIWFGDRAVRCADDVPRQKAFGNTLWYMTSSVSPVEIARLLGPDDSAFGPSVGQVWGVNFKTKHSTMKVLSALCWGVETPDPEACRVELESIFSDVLSGDMRLGNSASATALSLWIDFFDGKNGRVSLRQLPCRWRPLAQAALHQGPVTVMSGGAEHAVHLDVRSAYLSSLYDHVPVVGIKDGERVGGWVTDTSSWDDLRYRMGFVEALVCVRSFGVGEVPPLPVHAILAGGPGVVYPSGVVRGAWSIDQVREAEERGEVEVLKVFQSAFATRTEPVFEDMAEFMGHLPKRTSKLLYTRFWGKLGSRGGFRAVRSPTPVHGTVPSAGLWWSDERISTFSYLARPTFRPDIAAIVLARNQRQIVAATRRLRQGSIVATHIDAIWTTDLEGARAMSAESERRAGGWHIKEGPSPLRYFGVGVYQHGDRLRCSGLDQRTEPLTADRLADFVRASSKDRRSLLESRVWSADPAIDASATSRPLEVDMAGHQPIASPDVADREVWTSGGWATDRYAYPPRREIDGEERDLDVD